MQNVQLSWYTFIIYLNFSIVNSKKLNEYYNKDTCFTTFSMITTCGVSSKFNDTIPTTTFVIVWMTDACIHKVAF